MTNLSLGLAERINTGKFANKIAVMMRLSDLVKGQKGVIKKIEDGPFTVQLMEMGFIAGKPVQVVHIAPFGDPIAVQVAGYVLSIRKTDAAHIWVEL